VVGCEGEEGVISVLFVGVVLTSEPPTEAPSVEVVKEALKKNYERIQNRRVKYVQVRFPEGETKKFPSIDGPDRTEYERVIASDKRFREKVTTYRAGALVKEEQAAFDGKKGMKLERSAGAKGMRTEAKIVLPMDINTYNTQLEMGWANSVQPLHTELGIRAEATIDSTSSKLVRLDPNRDDRVQERRVFILDPAKEYWPIEWLWERKSSDGRWQNDYRYAVVEFMETPKGVYPKRMTQYAKHSNTMHVYTVLAVEFPEKLEDEEFALTIPDGVMVEDRTTGRKYYQGGAEIPRPAGKSAAREAVESMRAGDWLVYGGFAAGVVLVGVGAVWFSRRGKGEAEGDG